MVAGKTEEEVVGRVAETKNGFVIEGGSRPCCCCCCGKEEEEELRASPTWPPS